MPRDLPLGNGRLLITFDRQYHIRDLYYPRVGGENHASGHPFRFGVWADGEFGWVHDDDWRRDLDYFDDTMVTQVVLRSERLRLELHCTDAVDFHESVFLRRVAVRDIAGRPREVRLFFHHDFHISDFEVGDTAYYEPEMDAVIHYKGRRYFLANIRTASGEGISDYATGYKEMPGREGTWRDAEGDGVLCKSPISQGSVDSTVAGRLQVPANGEDALHYWICVETNHQGLMTLNSVVLDKGPQALIDRTAAYWRLWSSKEMFEFADLPESVVKLFRRSLIIIRTQIDNGGAIIAANDTDITQFNRDTYSYMWPRDGALVAHALDIAGDKTLADQFYAFCCPLLTRGGYFLHKYNPDGSAGSSWHPWLESGAARLPIQEDETALVLWALWKHFEKYRDVERIKPLYRDMVIAAGEFLASYMDDSHDLPLPSYDLWEERRGVHAWTVGATYGGLIAAQNFARAFGETVIADRFSAAADRIRRGVEAHFWKPEANRFVRMLRFGQEGPEGSEEVDWTLDSAILGLLFFGMFPADDPRIESTAAALHDRLWIKTDVGGMARYENDYYHQVSQDVANVAGNPWFVCTLWIAQYWIARATTEEELAKALPAIQWAVDHALPSGVLAEQVDPYTHAPLSVSPLTWSHASFVTTVVEYLDRKSELSCCPECGQPLFTKEREKLRQLRQHKHIHANGGMQKSK
jgi:GH15 family glucan-1,4-alpha-glucosidase